MKTITILASITFTKKNVRMDKQNVVKYKENSKDNNTSDNSSGLGITLLVTSKCRQLQSVFINKSLVFPKSKNILKIFQMKNRL